MLSTILPWTSGTLEAWSRAEHMIGILKKMNEQAGSNPTQSLCEKITNIDFNELSEDVRSHTTQLFIDGIAVAMAGTCQEKPPAMLAEHAKFLGGEAQATVFNFGFQTSLTQAALINGASMHVLDYEPMWNPPNHQLSTCLPAILALAEYNKSDGKTILTALAKGTEMMSRLRWAAPRQRDLSVVKFHPPGFIGPMGAAVASAHMLGLNAETLARSLGIVASRSSALWPNNGTDTKCLHCGMASSNGLDATLLASKGFSSNPDILGAPRGFVETFFDKDEFLWDEILKFGNPYRMVNPGYAIKMWPSQFGTHYIFTACFEIKSQIPDVDSIKSVVVVCPDLDYPDRPNPATGLAGKFSWQYATALALLDDQINMDSFTDSRRFSPDMEALLKKVTLDRSSEFNFDMTGEGEGFSIKVELHNGETLQANCNGPKGSWGKEPIPTSEFFQKIHECLSLALTEKDVQSVIALASRLEELDASEVAQLVHLLGNYSSIDDADNHPFTPGE